jgi:23S rRNA (uracil1939-C5)-methyltransferase
MVVARIDSLAHGPHGIARIDGKVHFVRNAAPGDEVELAVEEDHGAYAYARVTRVRTPGATRRAAPCPYLPRCGGCPWQHVAYAAQAAAKETSVRDLVARVGGVDPSVVGSILPAAAEYGYRRRLSLRVGARRRLGFMAAASHDVVPVERCLLADERLADAIPLAERWVAALATRVQRLEIVAASVTDGDDRVVLVAQADGAMVASDAETSAGWAKREPRIAGLVLRGRGFRRLWGDDRVRVPLIGGDEMWLRAGDFSQVSEQGNATLIAVVLELAGVTSDARVADLYAGAGNLSIPLARRAARVTAVERAPSSVEAARENARRLGLANLEVVAGATGRVLDGFVGEGRRFDVVVLDPPRAGAADALAALLELAPARVVYVSCNPATLARDLRTLARAYRVERVQPLDLFPQTYHVEAVARLELADLNV